MTNSAPVQVFSSDTPDDLEGGVLVCDGAGDAPAPAAQWDAADASDDVDVPTFDPSEVAPRSDRTRRSGLFVALGVSLAIHAGMIALGVWAVAAGIIPLNLPTLGSRGEMAEGGLSDDPGLSAMGGPAALLPPAVQTPAVTPALLDASLPETTDEPSMALAELFPSRPTELPAPDAAPLIGIGETPALVPARPVKDPLRSTADASPAGAAGTDADTQGATAEPAGVQTSGTAHDSSGSGTAQTPAEGDGAAAYTPPQVTGRDAGLSGRRGARGLDSRGLPIPDYPRPSRVRREEGTVVLIVTVNSNGHVQDVEIANTSGYRLLDEAAAVAIREAKFTPALLGGRAVGGTIRVPYRFRLE